MTTDPTLTAVPEAHQLTAGVNAELVPPTSKAASQIQSNWLFGDWTHTAEAGLKLLEQEPTDWPTLLYVGASLFQLGKTDEARETIRKAIEHGCPRKLAGRLLAAGANDSVGRAYAAAGDPQMALRCFHRSLDTLGVRENHPQLAKARICENFAQAGITVPWNVNLNALDDADFHPTALLAGNPTSRESEFSRHAKAWLRKIQGRTPLSRLCDASGSDKGFQKHLYTTVYEEFIKPGKVHALLEIGLFCHDDQKKAGLDYFSSAPSLTMWAEYLPDARIYGYDIKDFTSARGEWTGIIQGDQSKPKDLAKLRELGESFDVIIDDGLHASKHQQVSFSCLFELVKPGGLYIIEDLHYQPDKDEQELKTREALKTLKQGGKWTSAHATPEQITFIENNVEDILFFDSMKLPRTTSRDAIAVIRKRVTPPNATESLAEPRASNLSESRSSVSPRSTRNRKRARKR